MGINNLCHRLLCQHIVMWSLNNNMLHVTRNSAMKGNMLYVHVYCMLHYQSFNYNVIVCVRVIIMHACVLLSYCEIHITNSSRGIK